MEIHDSSPTVPQQPSWVPSGKCDGASFQASDGCVPRAAGKKSRKGLRGTLVKIKHSSTFQGMLSASSQKKSKRSASGVVDTAAVDTGVTVQAVVGGQADGTRRKSSSGSFSGSPAGSILADGTGEGRVSFDDDHDIYVNDTHDDFHERPIDVPDDKSSSASSGLFKTFKRSVSGRFSLHRAHAGTSITEVGASDGRGDKARAKQQQKKERKVGKKARALVGCLGDAFTEVVKKEKVQTNSVLQRSMRKAKQTMSHAKEFAQQKLDPLTHGGVTALTGGKSIEKDFADRMRAFINTCEDAGLPTNDLMYVQPLRDALKHAHLYDLRRIRFYAKEPDFRLKAKAMYSADSSDSDDSADSSASADRKRNVEVLLNNLDQAATEQMKLRLQQAPVAALFNAGLLIQMHGEDYKTLLPVIADSFVDLYKGYRCGLHHAGETEQAYIARVIAEHAPEWMQLPIRVALGADPDCTSCSQAEVADTIARSMLGAKKPPIAALLAVGKLLKKQALSSRDSAVSHALAETLRASDAGIQKENVASAVGEVIAAVRHAVSVARSEAPLEAGDAQYALGRLFFENLSRIAAAQPQQISAATVVPFDAQAVQLSLAKIADVSKAETSRAGQESQVAQAAQAGPASGNVDAAPDAATEQTLKMLLSPYPTWGKIPERRGEMLVYHRGGVIRRVSREIWFHVKSAFKSGRALQEARALRRHVNVTSGVHRVVHNVFLPEDAKTTFRKLDVETRALIAAVKQLARSEGADYAWAYVRKEMETALATGRRGQLQDAGKLLFGEPIRPLVLSGKQRRWRTRVWHYVIGKFFDMPSDSTVVGQASQIRAVAAESLNKVVVNIMLRDVLARIVKARRDERPIETFDAFKSLMEAYAASGGGEDFEAWLVPAVQLLDPKDVKWMMNKLGKHSLSNGGYMIEFFKPSLASVKLLVDKQEYIVYEDFAEALYRACAKVDADKERLGFGASESSDAGSEGGQTTGQTSSESGNQAGSESSSQAGSPVLALASGAIGRINKAELMLEAGKMILPHVAPPAPAETVL